MSDSHTHDLDATQEPERRTAITTLGTVGMAVGLTAAYGTLAAFMGRFLYPAKPPDRGWMYVTDLKSFPSGGSIVFQTPAGAKVNIARLGEGPEGIVALSSTCPHLGCQVHWESANNRFFCPCHNGTFDPAGKATGGPPGEAGMSLPKYPLKQEGGLLYIEVPVGEMAMGPGRVIENPEGPKGPGHDPCLFPGGDVRRA